MRKVDPIRREGKRQQIMDAAVRCFVRRGFHGASIAELCAEAGMSAGHLYHYFPSKEAIVAAIVESNLQRAADRFSRAAADGASVSEVLDAQLRDAVRDDGARMPLLFDMLAEAGRNAVAAKALAHHSKHMYALVIDLLRGGQASGEIDPSLDAEAMTAMVLGVIDAAKTMAVRYPDAEPGWLAGIARTLLERCLLAPPGVPTGTSPQPITTTPMGTLRHCFVRDGSSVRPRR